MNTIGFDKKRTLMVAHRGVSGLETENTCAAFVAAGNRSYFGIETDVHVTKDGRFIIIHDDDTARVGIDKLIVEETTFDTLRSIMLLDKNGKRGRTDLRLPELTEYLGICKRYEKKAVLELKNRMEPEQVKNIAEITRETGMFEDTIFISFSIENLVDLKRYFPDATAQFLTCDYSDSLMDELSEMGLGLDILYKALTKKSITYAHSKGVMVNCWTVNEPADGEKLASWGVDMITSNILE